VILVAIIALGAGGLILMLLAIANPRIDDDLRDVPTASKEHVPLRLVTRRDGPPPARRFARPAMEAHVIRREEPPRRSTIRKAWRRQRSDAVDRGSSQTRLRGLLASPDARFVGGTVACSLAVGLLIAHLSV
jgi:hypothetical protein